VSTVLLLAEVLKMQMSMIHKSGISFDDSVYCDSSTILLLAGVLEMLKSMVL